MCPQNDLFAPPRPDELAKAKLKSQDLFSPPTEEELKRVKNSLLDKPEDIPYVRPENVDDEIPMSTGAALSFGSNDAEKRGYLRQAYPGIEIGKIRGQKTDGSDDTPVVKLPNEQRYRYVNKPGLSWGDVAGLAGDIPGVVGGVVGGLLAGPGAIAGAAGGSAVGEAGRKLIGRELIGIPRGQTLTEDVADVGIAGAIGGVAQGAINVAAPYAKGLLSRLTGNVANQVDDVAKAGVKAATPAVQSATSAVASPAAQQVATTQASDLVQDKLSKSLPPQSVKDLVSRYGPGSKLSQNTELPSGQRLKQIVEILPDLEQKPLPVHFDMLKDKTSRDILRLRKELPDAVGESLGRYEQIMKDEAQAKVGQLVESVTRRQPLSKIEAGENLINQVKGAYEATKDSLAPLFEQFEKVRLPKTKIIPEIQNKLITDIPKLKPYLAFDEETGNLLIKPFSPKMGITENAYSKLQSVIGALNSKSLSFREMQHIREYLRQSIDPVNPKSTQILGDARKSLLGYMQDLMGEYKPKANVKKTFQQYAQNEQFLEQMERIMGGKVENFDQLLQAAPDRILDRVFLNSKNMDVTRKLMGEQRFRELMGDYMYSMVQKATDQGGLSANKLMSLWKQKADVLKRALQPGESQRFEALVDLMRIIPDAPSPNPSGTAKASQILGGMKKAVVGSPLEGGKEIISSIQEALKGRNATIELNAILGNVPPEKRIGLIQRAINVSKDPYVQQAGKGFLMQEAQLGAQKGLLGKDRR